MICIGKNLFTGCLRMVLVFLILTIAPFIAESLLAVVHLDVFWYNLNGMGAKKMHSKSSFNTFTVYISRKS